MITAKNGEDGPLQGIAGPHCVPGKAAELDFDASRYWDYLEGIEATDDQKTALLETLWSIICNFVQLGFGEDPVQTVLPALIGAGIDETDETSRPGQFNARAQTRMEDEQE